MIKRVRIWIARLHDPDEIRGLEARVENELALHPAHLVQVDWLTAAAGGDAVCDINLIAIVTTGVPPLMTRAAFEAALDTGRLQTAVRYGKEDPRWYTCRRNGRTRLWKRDPARFEVPIKFRLRDTLRVTDHHFNSGCVDEWFRIAPEQDKAP